VLGQCFSTFLPQGTLKIIFNIWRKPPSVKMCTGQKKLTAMYVRFFHGISKFQNVVYSMISHRTPKWYFAEPSSGSDGLELWHQVYIAVTSSCGLRKIWRDLCVSHSLQWKSWVFFSPFFRLGVGT